MLLTALALLLTQQTYVGTGYSVEFPPERLVPSESAADGFYVFRLLDPARPDALVPPLRVLTSIEKDHKRSMRDWAFEARREAHAALTQRGLTPGERDDPADRRVLGNGVTRGFRCAHADGSEWWYLFNAQRIAGRPVLVSSCFPVDGAAQQAIDALHARKTLAAREWNADSPLVHGFFGVRSSLSMELTISSGYDAAQALIQAADADCELQLRFFKQTGPEEAAANAAAFRASLRDEVRRTVETEQPDYTVGEEFVTRHVVGGRTVEGRRFALAGRNGAPGGWRFEITVPFAAAVCHVSAIVRVGARERGFGRLRQVLAGLEGEVWGHDVALVRDGLGFQIDAGLESQREETTHGVRFAFRRRGVPHAQLGEIWIETRDDLPREADTDAVAATLRTEAFGERKPSAQHWRRTPLFGETARSACAEYFGDESAADMLTECFAVRHGEGRLVAGFVATRPEAPELRALLYLLLAGLQATDGATEMHYADRGATYTFDPRLWIVEGGADGASSTATLRKTTLTTSWAPKGGGLLGPGPELATALRERVEADKLGWTFTGKVGEPAFGDAGIGEVPSKYATLRRTDADGAQWEHVYMVADAPQGRLWVVVSSEVADSAAAKAIGVLLAAVRAK